MNNTTLESPIAFPNTGIVQKGASGSLFPFLKDLPLPFPFPLLRTGKLEFHLELFCDVLSLDELLSRQTLYFGTTRGSAANGLESSIGGSLIYEFAR